MSIYGSGIYWQRKLSYLDEAYIGKTENLAKIEEEFGKFRSRDLTMYSNLSTQPEIIAINRLFEKQFGMDIFALQIDKTQSIDAYTHVIAANFDIQRQEDLSTMVVGSMDNGFRFKEGNDFVIIVNVSYGLLFDKQYTNAEIVAVILHEIGHNFADCLYDKIRFSNKELWTAYENYLVSLATIKGFALILHDYRKAKKKAKEELEKNTNSNRRIEAYNANHKKPTWLKGLIEGLKGKHKDHKALKSEIKARKKGKRNAEAWKRQQGTHGQVQAKQSIGRQNEVFADKFAGVYGYGPELLRALTKMDYTKSEAAKKLEEHGGKFKKASKEFDEAVRDITEYDEHPSLVQRLMEELKLLRREYEKEDIDPRVKEVIKSQIDELEAILTEITRTSKKLSEDDQAKNAYNDYIRQNLPDAVEEEVEQAIEESLDRLLDEDKKKRRK